MQKNNIEVNGANKKFGLLRFEILSVLQPSSLFMQRRKRFDV